MARVGKVLSVALLFLTSEVAHPDDRLAAHTSVLGITLEQHTFQDMFRLLGPTEVRDNGGDAAANGTTACYVGADGTTLALISDGELGGGWLTSFHLAATRALVDFSSDVGGSYVVPKALQPRCAKLAKLSRSTSTAGGLQLGMTRDQVVQLLGNPCDRRKQTVRFCSKEKRHSTASEKARFRRQWGEGDYESFEVFRWVQVMFRGGEAVAIRVDAAIT